MTVRSVARGLSPEELEHIRAGLAAGRRPKVVFTSAAGQIAGQLGQVVALTDPADSEEWVVVRFGRDELPFSPTDLAIAPKGAESRRSGNAAGRASAAPVTAPGAPLLPPAGVAPPPVVPAAAVASPREERAVAGQEGGGDRVQPGAARPASAGRQRPEGGSTSGGSGGKEPPVVKAAGRKAGRARPPSELTVTLSYAEGEWTVAAQQGGKVLARPYVIRAVEALKLAGMVDVPAVREAVEEIVAAERVAAEAAAARLRAELAEVEARLAELRDAT